MRLPDDAYEMVEKRKVKVFFANRGTVAYWNENRLGGELRYYTGWYWYIEGPTGRAETEEHGPFHSRSAAYRDAAVKLQVRVPEKKAPAQTTQVTGSGTKVVSLSGYTRRNGRLGALRSKSPNRRRHLQA